MYVRVSNAGYVVRGDVNYVKIFLQHKCYILATVDRDLKRRVRKIPGVPIMYISNHR